MNKNLRTVPLYGNIKPKSDKKHRFDESLLFQKEMHYAILIKRLKVYFGNNKKGNKTLLGIKASYVNYLNGQKVEGKYVGGEKVGDNIEIKEIIMKENEYINNCELDFDNCITYFKIMTSKGNELEVGERPEKVKIFINFEGDNMIQFFWGDYENDDGINAIAFKYISRKNFIFGTIIPILWLRFKINHEKDFKKKLEKIYQQQLIKNLSMIYLYRVCLLPEAIFSRIIKYC